MSDDVKPWDLLDPSNYTTNEIAQLRYNFCSSCEFFVKTTKRCSDCGCFMILKTKLDHAKCPIGKW